MNDGPPRAGYAPLHAERAASNVGRQVARALTGGHGCPRVSKKAHFSCLPH